MKYGALPPTNLEWQLGKTAASIAFVNAADQAFTDGQLTQEEWMFLATRVREIKSGKIVLQDWQTVQEFLREVERDVTSVTST